MGHAFVPGRQPPTPPVPIIERTGRPPAETTTGEERRCSRPGLTLYHRYGDGRYRCKRCVGKAVTRRHQKVKRILVGEAAGCCAVCGYDRCVFNLHLRHVDPAAKSCGISVTAGRSLAAYREEARKCVLVCANCHGEIETGLRPSPRAGATYTGRQAPMV